jgi:hypothetical protein
MNALSNSSETSENKQFSGTHICCPCLCLAQWQDTLRTPNIGLYLNFCSGCNRWKWFTPGNCGFLERSRRLDVKTQFSDCHLFLRSTYTIALVLTQFVVLRLSLQLQWVRIWYLLTTAVHGTQKFQEICTIYIDIYKHTATSGIQQKQTRIHLIIQYFKIIIIIEFLDIMHHPVLFYLDYVLETGFCLRLQVEPTQLGPIDTASPYLRTPAPTQDSIPVSSFRWNLLGWAQS